MSKREKSVQVTIDEQKLPDGGTMSVLKIGDETIGTVTPVEDRLEAQLNDGDVYRVKTVDEGVELLLKDYHLHRG
ncbi:MULTISPECIES: DUF2969 domain-containing protein [Levilactobacillus]|jgi:hypothetical protein|uniref:DUF2969 domain-containing protein n=2 Tax=Levilactobacillus TaxID=2767886 RepID=A0A4Z0JA44_9LACO|nr:MULTISPECIES: DUF2969 domain-containing protein [Levilactobacillus]MCH4123922.1 DUF2969 domain-containing protein [Levilactobacillus sp.]MCI1554242.1 DUF2969 domain-containing protein [Levilactobacillus sp.]MCI1598826.1 DUF2969 domain-containing protein [Levilactobacillus sp.]MCI1605403.1 DUF2969 domain-containing protein [Levilactobacillus sp.]TGD19219.1 DUF2969 domain-containing protein [Levilactobacillus suantsaiihabitans]